MLNQWQELKYRKEQRLSLFHRKIKTFLLIFFISEIAFSFTRKEFIASNVVAVFNHHLVTDLEFMICDQNNLCQNYYHFIDDISYRYDKRKIDPDGKVHRVKTLINHLVKGIDKGVLKIDKAEFYVNGGVYFEGFILDFKSSR